MYALAVLSVVTGTAPAPSTATVAPVPAEGEAPHDAPVVDEEELADMKKWRVPAPPSTNPRRYAAWKKKLPAAVQKRIFQYCRHYGGDPRATCNGIGPLSLPEPGIVGFNPDMSRVSYGWEESLSVAQRSYYEDYCAIHDPVGPDGTPSARVLAHTYTTLCGGTPLVLAFHDERVAFAAGDAMDWPTSTTPWLVLDRDGDGAIATSELFGSATPLASGRLAKNGFQPLAELDANGDGVLDAHDPMFAKLAVWADANGDRASSADELSALSSRVVSLSLAAARQPACDARRNCEGERSAFTWRDERGALHTGSVIDVYLAYR